MQQFKRHDLFCETTCKSFRCSERFLKIVRKRDQKILMCGMVEGDECIGYKCKYAVCTFRPSALDILTGTCAQKKKLFQHKSKKPEPHKRESEDPLKYRKMLSKKLKKSFKIKDFY